MSGWAKGIAEEVMPYENDFEQYVDGCQWLHQPICHFTPDLQGRHQSFTRARSIFKYAVYLREKT